MLALGRSLFVAGMLALTAAPSAVNQSAPRAFDVATVRASPQGGRLSQRVLPSRIDFASTSLRTLVLTAFQLEPYQLSAPDWLATVRFDIQATYPVGATQADVPEMLRTLLKERFGLVMRVEPRQMDALELIVGPGGPKMQAVEAVDELDKDFAAPSGQRPTTDTVVETPDGPVRSMVIPGEVGSRRVTRRSMYELRTTMNRTQLIDAVRITMSEFVTLLRVNLDKPVIDRTGLTGLYRFKVELDAMQLATRILRTDVNGNPIDGPTGVSTFKAVEGLGLKLEQRRSPVDVHVVDRISRTPTPN